MNILILSWRGPGHPNAGGAEICTHEHAKAWIKSGHRVTLFTSYYKGAKKEELIDGIRIIRRGGQFFGVHARVFMWYLFNRTEKFDLVVDHFHGISFFTPLYVRTYKLAFIHEITKEVWKLNDFPSPLNIFAEIAMFLEPFIFKLYKKTPFMTVSASTKRDLLAWGIPERNISIINNGISLPLLKNLPKKEKRKTIIYLGALTKDKGIEDALSVFAILGKKYPEWRFWVAGKSEAQYFKKLKDKSKSFNLKGKIKFWGYVTEQKKYNLLGRSDLLINPSFREGWGLVIIEAAGMGTPSVGYNVAGLRDSIVDGKTGFLSECRPEEMALKVEELLKNEKKYETIRRNALDWSKNFSWKNAGKKSLSLISKITH